VLQLDLDLGWGSGHVVRDRVAIGSRWRMASGDRWRLRSYFFYYSLVEVRDGGQFDRWLKGKVNLCMCVVLRCASCFHHCNCEF
jgi:hypothetical protein